MTIPKVLQFAVLGAGGMLAKALVDSEVENFKGLKAALMQARANMVAVQSMIDVGNGPNVTDAQRSEVIKNAAVLASASAQEISRELLKIAIPLPQALRKLVDDSRAALDEVFKVARDALPSFVVWQLVMAAVGVGILWKMFVSKGK